MREHKPFFLSPTGTVLVDFERVDANLAFEERVGNRATGGKDGRAGTVVGHGRDSWRRGGQGREGWKEESVGHVGGDGTGGRQSVRGDGGQTQSFGASLASLAASPGGSQRPIPTSGPPRVHEMRG
jgi:hypothetical protein